MGVNFKKFSRLRVIREFADKLKYSYDSTLLQGFFTLVLSLRVHEIPKSRGAKADDKNAWARISNYHGEKKKQQIIFILVCHCDLCLSKWLPMFSIQLNVTMNLYFSNARLCVNLYRTGLAIILSINSSLPGNFENVLWLPVDIYLSSFDKNGTGLNAVFCVIITLAFRIFFIFFVKWRPFMICGMRL